MNRHSYLVSGAVTIYQVHVDPEYGTTYNPYAEYEAKEYFLDTYTPGDARWQAAIQALGKHVKTAELEWDKELSFPNIGHGRYTILDGDMLYVFQGISFQRSTE